MLFVSRVRLALLQINQNVRYCIMVGKVGNARKGIGTNLTYLILRELQFLRRMEYSVVIENVIEKSKPKSVSVTSIYTTLSRITSSDPPYLRKYKEGGVKFLESTPIGKKYFLDIEAARLSATDDKLQEADAKKYAKDRMNKQIISSKRPQISDTEQVIQKFEAYYTIIMQDKVFKRRYIDDERQLMFVPLSRIKQDDTIFSLEMFDIDLADEVLRNPLDMRWCASEAMNRMSENADFPEWEVYFTDLSKYDRFLISDLTSNKMTTLISIDTLVRRISPLQPLIFEAEFDCANCGNVINVPQNDDHFSKPTQCICGGKQFRCTNKNYIDCLHLKVTEIPEQIETSQQPQDLYCIVRGTIAKATKDQGISAGSQVRITGVLLNRPVRRQRGQESNLCEFFLEVFDVQSLAEEIDIKDLTTEDIEQIIALSKNEDCLDILTRSVCPSIYAEEGTPIWHWKRCLILQAFGGVRRIDKKTGSVTRGDIHLYAGGEPGVGKSVVLKWFSKLFPRGVYCTGKGSSGRGLTAVVVRDETSKNPILEAGSLVLANKGMACIDEMPRMGVEELTHMNEAMEQQTVTIHKWGIQATLQSQTPVCAVGNPVNDRFSEYEPPAEQLGLPPTIQDRFDLMVILKDTPEAARDQATMELMARKHSGEELIDPADGEAIPRELLAKYIRYARSKFNPIVKGHCAATLTHYFMTLRKSAQSTYSQPIIPISMRQGDALFRVSQSMARIRLRKTATTECAAVAIDTVRYCMESLAYNPETGTVDASLYMLGRKATTSTKMAIAKATLDEMVRNYEDRLVPEKDYHEALRARHHWEEGEVEKIIELLLEDGEIQIPKPHRIRRVI